MADVVARNLTNAPLAEARLRFAIACSAADSLTDDRIAFPQFQKVEELAGSVGAPGSHLALRAQLRTLASRMWNDLDESAALELIAFGDRREKDNPSDLELAAFAFTGAAEFMMENGLPEQAARLATRGSQLAAGHASRLLTHLSACYTLMQVRAQPGASSAARDAAKDVLVTLGKLRENNPNDFTHALNFISIGDWSLFPEDVLTEHLSQLAPEDELARTVFKGVLGCVIARNGDWERGLSTMLDGTVQRLLPALMWDAQISLAALLDKRRLQESLAIAGLAAYAGSADGDRAGWIAENVLLLPSYESFLPTVTNLTARANDVPTFLRWQFAVKHAFFSYRSGDVGRSHQILDGFFQKTPPTMARLSQPIRAHGYFLRAILYAEAGDDTKARLAYREGMNHHPADFAVPGTPYRRPFYWVDACKAEVIRREAVKRMHNAGDSGF